MLVVDEMRAVTLPKEALKINQSALQLLIMVVTLRINGRQSQRSLTRWRHRLLHFVVGDHC